jgi:predicted RND superfamily exporter protein
MLVVASFFGAMQLTMAAGIETFMSTESQVYKDRARFDQHFSSEAIVVLVTGDDITQLLQPENVRAMETVESQMGANPKVISVIGPAFLIKQAVAQQADRYDLI